MRETSHSGVTEVIFCSLEEVIIFRYKIFIFYTLFPCHVIKSLFYSQDDVYTLLHVNNNWYLFFRLHQILCDRLYKIYSHSQKIAAEEALCRKDRKESTAIALRLKAPSMIIYL